MDNRTHSIYMFFDEEGTPFYVGKTVNFKNRVKKHRYKVNEGSHYYCHNKLRLVLQKIPVYLAIREISSGIPGNQIDQAEMGWIKFLKENLSYKLTNLTNGGEGGKGYTSETIKKIAAKNKGKKRSKETREKMSRARMGIVFSADHIRNLCLKRQNRVTKLETREKLKQSLMGKNRKYKQYILTDSKGVIYETDNITQFCKDHEITVTNIFKVLKGARSSANGFSIKEKI